MKNIADRMSEVEARLAVATPGEWEVYEEPDVGLPPSLFRRLPGQRHNDPIPAREPLEPLSPNDIRFVAHAPADIRWLIDQLRAARSERLEAAHNNNALRSEIAIMKVEHGKSLRQALSLMTHILELARALRDAAIGAEDWQTKHAATLEAVKKVLGV